jgi:hypothetical protein
MVKDKDKVNGLRLGLGLALRVGDKMDYLGIINSPR